MKNRLSALNVLTAVLTAALALTITSAVAGAQEMDEGPTVVYEGPAVLAQNLQFTPNVLTIPAGTTLTWINGDPFQHTVTADDGTFDSGLVDAGQAFSLLFPDPGVYAYYCIPHGAPGGAGMAGTVIVES
jgi:plastocyanin